ncbi:ComEC/Rec2 family competence protein [Gluconobacter oxydans]|nr:hypothetical protein [Gluconobacter oxydans]
MSINNSKNIKTRFRAYQLETDGSLFSYWAEGKFTLIEARFTNLSASQLQAEMEACGSPFVDTLHITSWDNDHCSCTEIQDLLETTCPTKIECPGYSPKSQNGFKSIEIIEKYISDSMRSNRPAHIKNISPEYISLLDEAVESEYRDIYYNPRYLDDCCGNNNSTVKLFRYGCFNVLSLGDVESSNISSYLRRRRILQRETDIMLLAHHGADNGFTTNKLINHIKPSVAICSSNRGNQYDHPPQSIRNILQNNSVPLCTTKDGDVIIESVGDHTGKYLVTNYQTGSTQIKNSFTANAKKKKILSYNRDTLRNIQKGTPSYRKIK